MADTGDGMVTHEMQLRIESVDGSPINDYRVADGEVQVRSLTPSGQPYPGHASDWRSLNRNELGLHDALGTVVSRWLRIRYAQIPVDFDRAA